MNAAEYHKRDARRRLALQIIDRTAITVVVFLVGAAFGALLFLWAFK